MGKKKGIVPVERVQSYILRIRGHNIILDRDLAWLYGVPTKRLNEQVKRNKDRFPEDFMFQLTWEEAKALRSQIATLNGGDAERPGSQNATLKRGANIKYRPYTFTEHGAIMAANVLNSPKAVQASVFVVRAFVQLRQMLSTHKDLARKIDELDRKVQTHDTAIIELVRAIKALMQPPEAPKGRIGFRAQEGKNE